MRRDGDRGGEGGECDCVGDHGGGEGHGRARVAGIHSPVPQVLAFSPSSAPCPGAHRATGGSESNGRPTNLAPHWASSTEYHERITWDMIKS
jgi:hypothetical protein